MTAAKMLSAVERSSGITGAGSAAARRSPDRSASRSGFSRKRTRSTASWTSGRRGGGGVARLRGRTRVRRARSARTAEGCSVRRAGHRPGRAQRRALEPSEQGALEHLAELAKRPPPPRDRADAPAQDPLVRYVLLDAVASVLGPAVKLWNTGHGATVMREAVSLMGGHGVTEDCPASSATSGWTRSSKRPTRGPRPCSAASCRSR